MQEHRFVNACRRGWQRP